jgi:hypothetical protein
MTCWTALRQQVRYVTCYMSLTRITMKVASVQAHMLASAAAAAAAAAAED